MKKIMLFKIGVFICLFMFGTSSLTVSASSKTLTKPLTVTETEVQTELEPAESTHGPLTPDGNLNLVDDYGSTQGTGKQFITVETKSGQFFYIIIDRDDNGMETVHFLNKVEEEDLLALMEDEAVQEYLESTANIENMDSQSDKHVEETDKNSEGETEEAEDSKEEPAVVGLPPVTSLLLMGSVMGAGGIGGYFYLKKNKKVQPSDVLEEETEDELSDELDEADFDDEDLDIDEEEE